MNETTPIAVAPETSPALSTHNAAVQRCCQARELSLESSRKNGLDHYKAKEKASEAYRNAMPDLSGYQNIRDFIACVTRGLINGAIHPIEAPKFFYAAQVATGALHCEPKDQKRPTTPSPLSASNHPQVTAQ